MYFVLTTQGRDYMHSNPGVVPGLTTFELGSAYGYLPVPTQAGAKGTVLHTGVPSAGFRVNQTTIKYSIYLDYNVSSFSFGECVLYLNDMVFAIGTSSEAIGKLQLDGINTGSSLTLDCYIIQNGSGDYSMYDDLSKSDSELSVQNLGSLDRLPSASGANPNVYAVSSPSGERDSILAVSNNALWSFTEYTTFNVGIPVLAIGPGYIEFPYSTLILNQVADSRLGTKGSVIFQFIDGICVGIPRVVNTTVEVGTSTVRYTYDTPFLQSPSAGDRVKIYVKQVQGSKYWSFLEGLDPSLTAGLVNSLLDYPPAGGLRRDSSNLLTSNFNFSGYRGINLADPQDDLDAVNKRTLVSSVQTAIDGVEHNSLELIQGGSAAERYHLTQSQHSYLAGLVSSGLPIATTSIAGIVRLGTDEDAGAGVSGTIALSPSALLTAVSTVTNNSLQSQLTSMIRRQNPLVQLGTVDPTGSTPAYPNVYINTSDSTNPKTFVYHQASATWYRVGGATGGPLVGSSLSITGGGASTLSGTLAVTGALTGSSATLSGNISAAGGAISGNFSVNGNTTLGAVSTFSVFAGAGGFNSSAGVSFGSTGTTSTLAGTVSSTGVLNATVLNVSGASALAGLTTSGNVTLGASGTATHTIRGTVSFPNTISATVLNVSGASSLATLTTSGNVTLGSAGSTHTINGTTNLTTVAATTISTTGNLTVGGNTLLNGNVTLGDGPADTITILGTLAGSSVDLDGVSVKSKGGTNTYVGPAGSYAIPGNANTGTNNIAIGAGALDAATGSNSSIVIGVNAAGIAGNYNTSIVVGKDAGGSGAGGPPTIVDSVIIGNNAGKSLVNTTNVTVIGTNAAQAFTTGQITAIGFNAAINTTTGTRNTVIGREAFTGNTAGNYNTIVGDLAGGNITGDFNTAIGSEALSSASSGINTAVGYRAGFTTSTGTRNTFLGYNVANGATTANDCIGIGHNALASYNSAGNMVAIGSFTNAFGNASVSCVVIGSTVDATNIRGNYTVAIGGGVGGGGTTNNNVIIGYQAFGNAASSGGGDNVAIGYQSSRLSATNRTQTVSVGSASTANSSGSISIGYGATITATTGASIVVGASSSTAAADCIVLGSGNLVPATSSGCFLLGSGVTISDSSAGALIASLNSATVTGANITALGTTLATLNVANSVTIGNNAHTSYRMYAASWSNISDARDKTEVSPLTEGLALVEKLNPVKFRWDMREGGRKDLDSGFIAQEVYSALTEEQNEYLGLVDTRDENQYLMSAGKLIPVMVNAIKELSASLETTKKELQELKSQLGV